VNLLLVSIRVASVRPRAVAVLVPGPRLDDADDANADRNADEMISLGEYAELLYDLDVRR
jgi:hypothetical protein